MFQDVPLLLYEAALLLCSFLPPRVALFLAGRVGALNFWWTSYQQPKPMSAIATQMVRRLGADPDLVQRWLRRTFELSAIQDCEDWLLPRLTRKTADRLVQIDGVEHLSAALGQGRGAVLVTAHFMSTRLVLGSLLLRGYPLVLRRPGRREAPSRSFSEWILRRSLRGLEALGCRLFYLAGRRQFASTYFWNALKRNEIVVQFADSVVTNERLIEVEFVNQMTRLDPEWAVLAATARAPVLPIWIHRPTRSGPAVAVIGEPLEVGRNHRAAVEQEARHFGAEILRDPACWNRWLNLLRRARNAQARPSEPVNE
jgi:lauroyl/myristoyl acyltransferase